MTRKNRLIEYLARKSLICFILTFIFNLAMNLLKVTTFLGNRSDVCASALRQIVIIGTDHITNRH